MIGLGVDNRELKRGVLTRSSTEGERRGGGGVTPPTWQLFVHLDREVVGLGHHHHATAIVARVEERFKLRFGHGHLHWLE